MLKIINLTDLSTILQLLINAMNEDKVNGVEISGNKIRILSIFSTSNKKSILASYLTLGTEKVFKSL